MNRVLIVEDDAVARRQLGQLFRFENFDVAEAESGEAGIAAASDVAPDLVVCDIMMPGMDGFGVLEALRNRPATALTPFIFLTAKAGSRDVRQGMNEGADDYITKPFDPEALLASARVRLARRRVQLEEAERRAADTGMLAAAALPREMEGCLGHLETLSEMLAARYDGDRQAGEIGKSIKTEVMRLRTLSERLRLYGELPSLYARRFSSTGGSMNASCSMQVAADTAHAVASQWDRVRDLEISASPASVPLPTSTLEILVRELVDNACKFSHVSTRIDLNIEPEDVFWKIVIADRGRGMPPEQIRDLGAFKQFWNGSERPCGLGIGLVLVQTLVRLHGGEVQIESQPGAGTRVSVMIPSE
ncbi:MAG TPA: response regulator [Bryobacteraceae bacterium]|nr:response regulator [Bryobacteraceae bacterium]